MSLSTESKQNIKQHLEEISTQKYRKNPRWKLRHSTRICKKQQQGLFSYILTNTEGSAAKIEHNLGEGDCEIIQCQNFTEERELKQTQWTRKKFP